MLYDLRTTATPSDEHGVACPYCQDEPCVTNVYLVDADGNGETLHTCESVVCIGAALARTDTTGHHGDDMPIVELSTAPMPWETSAPAPVLQLSGPSRRAGNVAERVA